MNVIQQDSVSVLVRPIGACNHNCSYCFDKDWHNDFRIISKETIEDLMNKLCKEYINIFWTWHGGEFTLVGKEWFSEMNWLIQKIAHYNGVELTICAQTNGSLLDDEWRKIFDTYNVNYGLSYDGEYGQIAQRGFPIPENVLNKSYSTITVITKKNIDYLIDIYEEGKKRYFNQLSYNFVFDTNKDKNLLGDLDYALEKYKEFVFYYLYDKNPEGVKERTTHQWISLALGKGADVCLFTDCVNQKNFFCITNTGDLWKCDTTYIKEFYLGNLSEFDNISDIFKTPAYMDIIELKRLQGKNCVKCENYQICSNGCIGNVLCDGKENIGPDKLHCLFMRKLLPDIYKEICDLSAEDLYKLNPCVKRELISKSYLPLSLKKKAWEEVYEK